MAPSMVAALAVRWQTSRAKSRVSRSSFGFDINESVCAIRTSESRFKNGDWSSCDESPCRNVPSNTTSPVVLSKSATTTVSFSVRVETFLERQKRPPASRAARTTAAAVSCQDFRLPDFDDSGAAPAVDSLPRFTVSRSARISAADWYRWSRSLSSALRMMGSSSGGTTEVTSLTGTGIAFAMPTNPRWPVAIS